MPLRLHKVVIGLVHVPGPGPGRIVESWQCLSGVEDGVTFQIGGRHRLRHVGGPVR